MKKILAAIALIISLALPAAAEYKPSEKRPYIGVGVTVDNLEYADISGANYNEGLMRRFMGLEIDFGVKNKDFGGELFYKISSTEGKAARVALTEWTEWYPYLEPPSRNEFSWEAFGLNASKYFHVSPTTAIFGTLGFGFYDGDVYVIVYDDPETEGVNESRASGISEHWNSELGILFGIGVDNKLTDEIHLVAGFRYIIISGDFLIDNMKELNLGFRWEF